MKVLVLGAGKMTEAILTGFKASENLSQWQIYSPSGVSAKNLAIKVGAQAVTELSEDLDPDWILIGCKPQQLRDLKITLNGKWKNVLYVSILAAITEEEQKNILGVTQLIRIMPNLPVEFKEGVTLISSTSAASRLGSFEALFGKLGMALTVKEEELDELTLLTGSAPAFFYEFASILSGAFTSLNESERERLVRQVLLGAAKSSKHSKKGLNEMTNAVTSKGGVTISVLEHWRSGGLKSLIEAGIMRGKKKTEELRALLRS